MLLCVFAKLRWLKDVQVTHRAAVITIVAASLLSRGLWAYFVQVIPESDFATYNNIAQTIFQSGVKGDHYIALFPHVIGYPIILAPFFSLFKTQALVAPTLNIVFGSATALVVFWIGKRLYDVKVAFVGAMLYCFWPSQISYVSLTCTEIAFSFLSSLIVLIFLTTTGAKRNGARSFLEFILLGIFLGVTNTVRPMSPVLLAAMIGYMVLFALKSEIGNIGRRSLLILCLVVSYLACSRSVRSSISQAIGLETASFPAGFSMYLGANEQADGRWNAGDSAYLGKLQLIPGITAQEIHKQLIAAAFERVRTNGIRNLKLFFTKYRSLWGTDDDGVNFDAEGQDALSAEKLNIRQHITGLNSLSNLYYAIALVLAGWAALKKNQPKGILLMYLIVLGVAAVHIFLEVQSRYHFMAIPFIAVIAGNGLAQIINWPTKERPQPPPPSHKSSYPLL
jgi:hypothetical protein